MNFKWMLDMLCEEPQHVIWTRWRNPAKGQAHCIKKHMPSYFSSSFDDSMVGTHHSHIPSAMLLFPLVFYTYGRLPLSLGKCSTEDL